MQIFFTYNKNEVVQALRFHFLRRPEVKTLLIFVNVFAIFSAALFFFHKVSPLAFLVSTMLWLSLMAAFWFIMPNTVYRKAETFKDAFKITFGEQRVRLENQKGFTDWDWEKFSFYMESPHFIHLYFDSRSFFLVPKSAVQKDGDLSALRQLLNQKIRGK